MKLLFTSDWQITWSNIDKCEVVLTDLLRISARESVSAIVHCGDVKHQLNPVDVRVINFGVKCVRKIKQAGLDIYIDEGNHDKLGMHDTSDNWFPALKESGATIISKPSVLDLKDGYKLHVVPFYRDHHVSKTAFDKVAKTADPYKSVLVFHHEIYGCKLNSVALSKSEQALKTGDLHWKRYMFCIGGHIHMTQLLTKNTRYVGSPFAQDWGEANQIKGYILIDLDLREWKFIQSDLPRLYDPKWPGYIPPKRWAGNSVRLRIRVPDGVPNVGSYLQTERDKAKSKYPDAIIVAVPEFNTAIKNVLNIKASNSDIENIVAYVDQTRNDSMGDSNEQLVALLQYYLSKTQMLSSHAQRLTLLSAEAKNFLCFKDIQLKFNVPGITVITGVNKDRPGHSNGSGKTSLLQLPLVSFFGKTLKGQTGDKWTRRFSKKVAFAKLTFKIANGSKCQIIQQRRPVKLKLLIDGKDKSTGSGVKGTQKAIEHLTGLTWETITNAMYIDQADVTSLLSGKDGVRKALFSKFLNLERFIKAQGLVKERATSCRSLWDTNDTLRCTLEEQKQLIFSFLESLPSKGQLRSALKKQKSLVRLKLMLDKQIETAEKTAIQYPDTQDLEDAISKAASSVVKFNTQADALDEQLDRMVDDERATCPTCFQPINHQLLNKQATAFKYRQDTLHSLASKQAKFVKIKKQQLNQLLTDYETQKSRVQELISSRQEINFKLAHCREELDRLTKSLKNVRTWRSELKSVSKSLVAVKKYLNNIDSELAMLKYVSKAFSQNGLPMYIAGHICPQLNAVAERYSQLFSDSELSVSFSMTDDSVDVSVINVHGGETVHDQSQGELRIASLIVGFALREVLSPCNVMILDEPGEGLDAQSARVFTKGLKEIASTIGPVFVTTHNPNVLAELAGERTLEVVKENRCSVVKELSA